MAWEHKSYLLYTALHKMWLMKLMFLLIAKFYMRNSDVTRYDCERLSGIYLLHKPGHIRLDVGIIYPIKFHTISFHTIFPLRFAIH